MANIGIIGAGNTGANIGFLMQEQQLAHVTFFDTQEGLGTGKALDIMEVAPLRHYSFSLAGGDTLDALKKCDAIVLAAGAAVTAEVTLQQALEKNYPIIQEYASKLSDYKGIVLIVTEPNEALATAFIAQSGLPPERVIALGATADAIRFEYLVAKKLGLSNENIASVVIGGHASLAVPLPSYTTVSGMPISYFLKPNEIDQLIENVQNADAYITTLLPRTGPYYAHAVAATRIIRAIICNTNSLLSAGVYLENQYNCKKQVMNVPAFISAAGLSKIVELELSKEEAAQFSKAKDAIQAMITGVQNK